MMLGIITCVLSSLALLYILLYNFFYYNFIDSLSLYSVLPLYFCMVTGLPGISLIMLGRGKRFSPMWIIVAGLSALAVIDMFPIFQNSDLAFAWQRGFFFTAFVPVTEVVLMDFIVAKKPEIRHPVSPAYTAFCAKCGTANEAGAKFCVSCGAKLERKTGRQSPQP